MDEGKRLSRHWSN
jgi:hypothetical protein